MRHLLLCAILLSLSAQKGTAQQELWDAIRTKDHFVMMRHALAPGTGDPDNFDIEDCSTQRNLNEEGRNQAIRISDLFRSNGIESADVYTSQWCRCIDTAELLDLGKESELPAINSFFRKYERKESQMKELNNWLDSHPLDQPMILVTHQVNITAFTDVFPSSGEMVVIKRISRGEYEVQGIIETL